MSGVVSDTSPLNYLVVIEHASVLASLYDFIVLPQSVVNEAHHPQSPPKFSTWLNRAPSWVIVAADPVPLPVLGLGSGETAAIALALVRTLPLLLDDAEARQAARRLGLEVTGVLGVLAEAARRKLLAFEDALHALQQTNFRAAPAVIDRARELSRLGTQAGS